MAAIGSVCGFAAAPVGAIELGDIRIESTLGQPLRASIAYALNPNETLYDFCVALRAPQVGGPIPSVTRANVSVTSNAIVLTGNTAVKDPLLNLRVAIDCPYTPHLVRDYTMIIDPVMPATRNTLVAESPAAPTRPAAPAITESRATTAPAVRRQEAPVLTSLAMESTYRVQNGDTISAIASRIEGRTTGVWDAVASLIAANPGAFVDGDANQLVSGSELFIPDLTETGPVTAAADAPEPVPAARTVRTFDTGTIVQAEPAEPAFAEPVAAEPAEAPAPEMTEPLAEAPEPAVESVDRRAEPEPADAIAADIAQAPAEAALPIESGQAPVEEVAIEPQPDPVSEPALRPGDVVIAAPTEPVEQPVVPVVRNVGSETSVAGDGSWILWLAAGGAVLLLAGGVFWGRLRDMFGSRAVNEPAPQPESPADEETVTSTIIDDVDFEFNDSVGNEAISLDADLDAGTGLQDGDDMDVAQDFGFDGTASDSNVDLELPAEASHEPERYETDIIPPTHRTEDSSILEAEIEPTDEEYDMSMIVDATKQSIGEDDLTAQDLKAFPLGADSDGEEYSVDNGTLATEMDLQVLEQDYEEEFTQTQAINKEIEEAAAELARSMAAQENDQNVTEVDFELEPTAVASSVADGPGMEPTAEMPASNEDPGLEPTAQMPANQVDPGLDPTVEMSMTEDDSGTHPELTANIPVDAEALNDDLVDSDITAKLAAAGSDLTVEMEVESGSVDTKKDGD